MRSVAVLILVSIAVMGAAKEPASQAVGFSEYGGNWTMQGDELFVDGGAGPKLICDFPPFSTGAVGVEILFPTSTGGNAGFVVKTSECGVGADHFNGYEVALETGGRSVIDTSQALPHTCM